MSDLNDDGYVDSPSHPQQEIEHQADIEDVVDEVLQDASTQAAITNLTVPAGASYVQAEATGTRTAVNQILGVLRDAGLIPAT